MSAVISTILSSAATSAVLVAVTATSMLLADVPSGLPDQARAAVWVMGGITFVVTFLSNVNKAVPAMRGLLGLGTAPANSFSASSPAPLPAHPHPHLVPHAELESRLERIEDKMDRNTATQRKELAALTATMQACFHDLARSIGKLEGSRPPS